VHLIHVYALDDIVCSTEITPAEVETIIAEFDDIFSEPTSLPPRRACDHRIPLISGTQTDAARCVNVNHRPVGNPKRKV
jgi:hypothetical protein